MDRIGGQMKNFCKLTTQSPAASYVPLPRFLLQDEALRGISNDAKVLYALLLDRASISPAERLRRAGRHDPAVLHLGAGANQAPPQPPERHADLPGVGVQRLDCSAQAGFGQTRPHYAKLPSGCKAYRKGGRRCTSLTPSSGCRMARSSA